jgi:predicted nuclease of predicted toxin-antitoxin system
MAETIRFHLDESVALAVAAGLRQHAIDVTTSHDAGLLHGPDREQLAHACAEGRVLVTHDADFFTLAREVPDHPGIVFGHMHSRSIGEIIRRLIVIHDTHAPEEMKGRVEYL